MCLSRGPRPVLCYKFSPSVAILDSQSVKTTFLGGQRGYDVAKHVKGHRGSGRKRHLVVDTLGLMLAIVVHRASIISGKVPALYC